MGDKYRFPFILDGRAGALTGAGSDGSDRMPVYDVDADATKTITLTELAIALGVGVGGGWVPAPEALTEWGGGTNDHVIGVSDAGKHLLLSLDNDHSLLNLTIDFDNLADGEEVWISASLVDGNYAGGGPQGTLIQAAGTRQFGFYATGNDTPDSVDSVAGSLINEGATVIGLFLRSGTEIIFHSLSGQFYTNASYQTGP
jgi:hypothetical protein